MTWDDGTPYLEEMASGVHLYVQPDGGWMINNCGVVVDETGTVVLVDTSSTERRTRGLLAEAARLSETVPSALVNTHHHPDHTFGNGFVAQQTVVIGHRLCREEVLLAGLEATRVIVAPEYGDLTVRAPELTFEDRMTLHLGFPVELIHVGHPAHTTNDVVVWLSEQRVLYAGDLAFNGGQPFVLEGSVSGYRDAISQIRELDAAVLAPGHGPICRGAEVGRLLSAMDDYLAFVQDVAAQTHPAGLTPLEAAVRHRDHAWSTWAESERFVGNLHRAYAELESPDTWTRLSIGAVWPDMMAFHGGPIPCHA